MIDYEKSAELNECTVEELKARFIKYPGSNKKVVAICEGCGIERDLSFNRYKELCHKCALNTPEYRERRSAIAKRTWSTPGAQDNASKIKKQFYKDHPEAKEIQSEKLKKYWADTGVRKKHSLKIIQYFADHPDSVKKRAAAAIRRGSDPCVRAAISVGLYKYYADNPSAGEEHGKRMVQYHIDHPEVKDKISSKILQYHIDHPEVKDKISRRMVQWHIDHPEAGIKAKLNAIARWANPATRQAMSELYKKNQGVRHHFIYDHAHQENHVVHITRSEHAAHHAWMRRNNIEVPHLNEDVAPWRR